ncbi:hypothetical protein Taro_009509 [Colocasia esculenta]|uniref:Uncharacterized protein n=1 Tax=Colocasia esculenta TaxID=4460 RepID=A0A843U532_COLES|nr:hypothetical protein [Colocasia esculenta]
MLLSPPCLTPPNIPQEVDSSKNALEVINQLPGGGPPDVAKVPPGGPNVKVMLLAKLREYKSDLNNLKSEVKRITSSNANQSAPEELLESGMAIVRVRSGSGSCLVLGSELWNCHIVPPICDPTIEAHQIERVERDDDEDEDSRSTTRSDEGLLFSGWTEDGKEVPPSISHTVEKASRSSVATAVMRPVGAS